LIIWTLNSQVSPCGHSTIVAAFWFNFEVIQILMNSKVIEKKYQFGHFFYWKLFKVIIVILNELLLIVQINGTHCDIPIHASPCTDHV
jgi:hypothetical protein